MLCHGVSPHKLLYEHLDRIYGIDNIDSIEMRKKDGWSACLNILLKDGTYIEQTGKKSIFINAFVNDLILRDCCYNCEFASIPRHGDITLGDLWTVKKLGLGKPYEEKSSIVLVNNEHGKELWNKAANKYKYVKDISDIPLTSLNTNIYKSNNNKKLVNRFWDLYFKSQKFEESVFKTLYNFNVGLIIYSSNNYGSCATNIALYHTIEQIGYKPIILDSLVSPYGISNNYIKNRFNISSSFMEKGDIYSPNYLCESFVLGSDYSLNFINNDITHTFKNFEYFLLAFVDDNKRKIAYAPSLGTPDIQKHKETKQLYINMLSRFDFLSFREIDSIEFCKKYFHLNSEHVLDPVFLVDKSFYENIALEVDNIPKITFIFAYILDSSYDKIKLLSEISKITNIPVFVVLDIGSYEKQNLLYKNENLTNIFLIEKPKFSEWIALLLKCKYIITDSFHGTCFALLFHKKFISLKNRNKKRFESISSMFGYYDSKDLCIYNNINEIYNENNFFKSIDYENVDKILKINIERCKQILKSNLSSKINIKPNTIQNIDFVRMWKKLFSTEKILEQNNNILTWNKYLDVLQYIPQKLNFTNDYKSKYIKIYIQGLPKEIHYELVNLNNNIYMCLHYENAENLNQYENIFSTISKKIKIPLKKSSNKLEINFLINNNYYREEILHFIYSTIDEIYKISTMY